LKQGGQLNMKEKSQLRAIPQSDYHNWVTGLEQKTAADAGRQQQRKLNSSKAWGKGAFVLGAILRLRREHMRRRERPLIKPALSDGARGHGKKTLTGRLDLDRMGGEKNGIPKIRGFRCGILVASATKVKITRNARRWQVVPEGIGHAPEHKKS